MNPVRTTFVADCTLMVFIQIVRPILRTGLIETVEAYNYGRLDVDASKVDALINGLLPVCRYLNFESTPSA